MIALVWGDVFDPAWVLFHVSNRACRVFARRSMDSESQAWSRTRANVGFSF